MYPRRVLVLMYALIAGTFAALVRLAPSDVHTLPQFLLLGQARIVMQLPIILLKSTKLLKLNYV